MKENINQMRKFSASSVNKKNVCQVSTQDCNKVVPK